jgi:hypothetical protein
MRTCLSIFCLLLAAGAARAHTLPQLEAKVAKYATRASQSYKQPCFCTNAGVDFGRSGVLRYAVATPNLGTRYLRVWCEVPRFDGFGAHVDETSCDTFMPLAN